MKHCVYACQGCRGCRVPANWTAEALEDVWETLDRPGSAVAWPNAWLAALSECGPEMSDRLALNCRSENGKQECFSGENVSVGETVFLISLSITAGAQVGFYYETPLSHGRALVSPDVLSSRLGSAGLAKLVLDIQRDVDLSDELRLCAPFASHTNAPSVFRSVVIWA